MLVPMPVCARPRAHASGVRRADLFANTPTLVPGMQQPQLHLSPAPPRDSAGDWPLLDPTMLDSPMLCYPPTCKRHRDNHWRFV